ncbi:MULTISPECIES: ATP-binding protein [Paraburkholderia]|uniref:ATP-binding protein n=1 Tax=Paraburkholderia TaxID=1822464 RepID=UPI0022556197|nr:MULTISPECIES: ATP-binding protein [Paraburkholderia]MCX4159327.1 ATP-binding protein [Paraburkholderia aspalathi]MDN7168726.1 ATP-binding protein [Paraburkholderia sp. SECH2]MDQ6397213.1 ATP-binding protein [Paraburkholderia aspalathi]
MRGIAFPKSLLTRNIALLIVLVVLSQVCSLVVLLHYMQRPRVERAAAVFASYVETLDGLLASVPSSEREALATRIDLRAHVPVDAAVEPLPTLWRAYRSYQRDVFLDSLRHYLPADMAVRWQDDAVQRIWIRMHAGGTPYWMALELPDDVQGGGLGTALLLTLGLALLAALTGYLLQRHINRPLQDLASATRRVSAGEAPAPLPTEGPTEIAEVSMAFNQMTQALQQSEATRALMLAGVSHDIRTPLTKLRLAMAMAIPSGADSAFVCTAESYLDQIDTILQQFMDYAGSGEREAAQPGDLNALIGQLAADFAGLGHDFELSLGNLPEFAFRPISMMRLLMNLMQNAVVYGRTGLSVRTWTEAGAAYVAVGDRGKGITAQELEQLKAPFQRGANARGHSGGTGLGLAIAERFARLHGGMLQFHAREGGGLEVWVVLPLGR